MKKIGYKVCRFVGNGEYASLTLDDRYKVTYRINERTKPRNRNYPLILFNTFLNAHTFCSVQAIEHMAILKVQYNRSSINHKRMEMRSWLITGDEACFTWPLTWPSGTLFASSILPIEVMEVIV